MNNDNITPGSNPDVNQLGTPGGQGAVGGQNPQEPIFTLSELKTALGKDFKDKDTALKSLKDTQSYVGRVGQLEGQLREFQGSNQTPAATGEIAAMKAQLEAIQEDNFFERNPDFKSLRPVVRTFAKANGKRLEEVIELPEIKDLVNKVSGYDKSQSMRTVLESNPRLASSQDKITKAQGLAATRSRKALNEAGELAVQSVMDVYPDFVK